MNSIENETIPNFWRKSEPNGNRAENCVAMTQEFDFIDIDCERQFCGACELDVTPVFVIRGICKVVWWKL